MAKKITLFLSCFILLLMIPGTSNGQSFQKALKKHRKSYKKSFLTDSRAPLDKNGVKQIRFFDPDPAYLVEAHFHSTPNAIPFEMATYSGITKPYRQYGLITFQLGQDTLQLALYQSITLSKMPGYKDHLFLPFKDLTNGDSSYGGGRYIDLTLQDIKNDRLTLDFNRAYNPWCAYSDGYNCPIPPIENHLDVPIPAGEAGFVIEH